MDIANRRFKTELFEPNRQSDLVQAVLAATPDVSASAIAVAADTVEQATEAAVDDDEVEQT